MSLKYLIPSLGAAAALMSACAPFTPYDPDRHETAPTLVTPDGSELVTSPEQDQLRTARDNVGQNTPPDGAAPGPSDPGPSGDGGSSTTSTGGADYRRAIPIPGREGFVFNPFTNNAVDVRGIPSGSLVYDPQDPNKDKHHFRVP